MANIPQLVGGVAGAERMTEAAEIHFVDSHTEGEPTRVIVSGGPDLGTGSIRDKLALFQQQGDAFRQSVILEPRGFEAIVGALLCEPTDPTCAAAVIFFNNRGTLGMCGHGAIGVAVTLHWLGRVGLGKQFLETPVGIVEVDLLGPQEVAIENVPSYRLRADVAVEVDGWGTVRGDVAWGGNWFFLSAQGPPPLSANRIPELSTFAQRVRDALEENHITGADGAEIDHIEFFEDSPTQDVHSRNFVYCPGGAYDRSPCGTGTSAKLACLAADGKLAPGAPWVQESIIGSRFCGTYRHGEENSIIPRITGTAYVCGEGRLLQHPNDPFKYGIGVG